MTCHSIILYVLYVSYMFIHAAGKFPSAKYEYDSYIDLFQTLENAIVNIDVIYSERITTTYGDIIKSRLEKWHNDLSDWAKLMYSLSPDIVNEHYMYMRTMTIFMIIVPATNSELFNMFYTTPDQKYILSDICDTILMDSIFHGIRSAIIQNVGVFEYNRNELMENELRNCYITHQTLNHLFVFNESTIFTKVNEMRQRHCYHKNSGKYNIRVKSIDQQVRIEKYISDVKYTSDIMFYGKIAGYISMLTCVFITFSMIQFAFT